MTRSHLDLVTTSLAFGGDAVARADDGRVVFLDRAAPGDRVRAAVVAEHRGYLRARVLEILAPGPSRREPGCPAFAAGCGGCQWLHVERAAQLAAKREIVTAALRRTGIGGVDVLDAAPPLGWRRRARFHRGRDDLGLLARRSHRVVGIERCPQLAPALERSLPALARLGGQEIAVLAGGRGDVHVAVGDDVGTLDGSALRPAESVNLGDDAAPFLASAAGFAQASAEGNLALRRLVLAACGPLDGAHVLELHAGGGNFSRDLGRAGARLVATEGDPAAVALLRQNLEAAGVAALVRALPAAAALAAAAAARPDVVLADPPRTGLLRDAAPLAALGARRVVLVSCDPPTLGRDLDVLLAAGYLVVAAQAVDLMPQTYHVETVVTLERPG